MVHPSTPYYSGTPFKNFGTPLGVQYTRLKSTDLEKAYDRMLKRAVVLFKKVRYPRDICKGGAGYV